MPSQKRRTHLLERGQNGRPSPPLAKSDTVTTFAPEAPSRTAVTRYTRPAC